MNILITGGASGLGEAITKILAKDPTNTVYFTYHNSESNAKKLESTYNNVISIKCNFKDPESLKTLISRMNQLNFDILINNAYCEPIENIHFHKIPPVDFLTNFKENIIPVIEITQTAITNFRKKKKGKIITVLTSSLVNNPPAGYAVYVANKGYLEKLTKVWANENIKFNITSNSVSPSFMRTDLTSDVDPRIIEEFTRNHPLKKLLTVEEVAETVHFLTIATMHMNGVDIILNAGTAIK